MVADFGYDRAGSYWTGRPGRGWLAELDLPPVSREIVTDCLASIDAPATVIERLDGELHQRAKADPRATGCSGRSTGHRGHEELALRFLPRLDPAARTLKLTCTGAGEEVVVDLGLVPAPGPSQDNPVGTNRKGPEHPFAGGTGAATTGRNWRHNRRLRAPGEALADDPARGCSSHSYALAEIQGSSARAADSTVHQSLVIAVGDGASPSPSPSRLLPVVDGRRFPGHGSPGDAVVTDCGRVTGPGALAAADIAVIAA